MPMRMYAWKKLCWHSSILFRRLPLRSGMGAVSFSHSHFHHRKHFFILIRYMYMNSEWRNFFVHSIYPKFCLLPKIINTIYREKNADSQIGFKQCYFIRILNAPFTTIQFRDIFYYKFYDWFSCFKNFLPYVQFFSMTHRARTVHLTKHTHNTESNWYSKSSSNRNHILLSPQLYKCHVMSCIFRFTHASWTYTVHVRFSFSSLAKLQHSWINSIERTLKLNKDLIGILWISQTLIFWLFLKLSNSIPKSEVVSRWYFEIHTVF